MSAMKRLLLCLGMMCVMAAGLQGQRVSAERNEPAQSVFCAGTYTGHLQGICVDDSGSIFWSWTTQLVKTDAQGRILANVAVPTHHGDLCYLDGRVYVAVNLGKFNEPAGQADSWVFVYDAVTLRELARHRLPEVVFGAGGIASDGKRFIVVGGLPPGSDNEVYEYDLDFKFQKSHALKTGYTVKGIQTVDFDAGAWWFSTYDEPRRVFRSDAQFNLNGQWVFDGSLGLCSIGKSHFLVGSNTVDEEGRHTGRSDRYRFSTDHGFVRAAGAMR